LLSNDKPVPSGCRRSRPSPFCWHHISKEADADDFIDALGERLAEHVYTAAEGVHND